MEKYTMFMGWKNQYSENEYTTQRGKLSTEKLMLLNYGVGEDS